MRFNKYLTLSFLTLLSIFSITVADAVIPKKVALMYHEKNRSTTAELDSLAKVVTYTISAPESDVSYMEQYASNPDYPYLGNLIYNSLTDDEAPPGTSIGEYNFLTSQSTIDTYGFLTPDEAFLHWSETTVARRETDAPLETWQAGDRIHTYTYDAENPRNRITPSFHTDAVIEARVDYVMSTLYPSTGIQPLGVMFDNVGQETYPLKVLISSGGGVMEHPTNANVLSSDFKKWYYYGIDANGDSTGVGVEEFLIRLKARIDAQGPKIIMANSGKRGPTASTISDILTKGLTIDTTFFEFSPSLLTTGSDTSAPLGWYNFFQTSLAQKPELTYAFFPAGVKNNTQYTGEQIISNWAFYLSYAPDNVDHIIQPNQFVNTPTASGYPAWFAQNNHPIQSFDPGPPLEGPSLVDSGNDGIGTPYRIYKRQFRDALVIVRPAFESVGDGLTYPVIAGAADSTTGAWEDTGVTVLLDNNYYALDPSTAEPITSSTVNSVVLRNGEGFILQNVGPVGASTTIGIPSLSGTYYNFPILVPEEVGDPPYAVVDDDTGEELPVTGRYFLAPEVSTAKRFRVYAGQESGVSGSAFDSLWTGVYQFEDSPTGGVLTDSGQLGYDKYTHLYNVQAPFATDSRENGVIGQAWHFGGELGTTVISDDPHGTTGTFSFSTWVKLDDLRSTDFLFQSENSFWMVAAQSNENNYTMEWQDYDRTPPQDLVIAGVTDLTFSAADTTVTSITTNFIDLGFSELGTIAFRNLVENANGFNFWIYEMRSPYELYLRKKAGTTIITLSDETGGSIDIYKGRSSKINFGPETGIPKNEWHHMGFVGRADSTITFYFDGVPASPWGTPIDVDLDFAWDLLNVGGSGNRVGIGGTFLWSELDRFNGAVDEFYMVDDELSDEEMYMLYQMQAAHMDPTYSYLNILGDDSLGPVINAELSGFRENIANPEGDNGPLQIAFDDPSGVDLTTSTDISNYTIVPTITLSHIEEVSNNGIITSVKLWPAEDWVNTTDYTITVNNVTDASPRANLIRDGFNTLSIQYNSPNADAPNLVGGLINTSHTVHYVYDVEPVVADVTGFFLYIWDGDSYLDNEINVPPAIGPSFLTNGLSVYVGNDALPDSTWYVLKVRKNSVANLSGSAQPFDQEVYISRGTPAYPGPGAVDTTAPVMTAVDIQGLDQIEATFSENIDPASGQNTANWLVFETAVGSGSPVTINSISVSNTRAILQVDSLAYSTVYTVQSANILDLASTPNASAQTAIQDTTLAGPAALPPAIVGVTVPNQTNVVIEFDQTLQVASASNVANYEVYQTAFPGIPYPLNSTVTVNGNIVTLTLDSVFNVDANITVGVQNISSTSGGTIPEGTTIEYSVNITRKYATIASSETLDANTVQLTYSENLSSIAGVSFNGLRLNPSPVTNVLLGTPTLTNNTVTFSTSLTINDGDQIYITSSGGELDSDGNSSPSGATSHTADIAVSDTTPPTISSVLGLKGNAALVTFNEPVTTTSSQNTSNWSIAGSQATSALRSATDSTKVTVTSTAALGSELSYTITANNISDIAGNVSGVLSTTFISADIEAPALLTATYVDSVTIDLLFSEAIVDSTADSPTNYRVYLASGSYSNAADRISISSVSVVDSVTTRLTTAELSPDTAYYIEIYGVTDDANNSAFSRTTLQTPVELQSIRITFTNSNEFDVNTTVRAIVPFTLDEGPPYPNNDIRLYNFSLEDENGNAELAEFFVLSVDPADSSVTELVITVKLDMPANTTIDRWLNWGLGEPNLPQYTELLAVTEKPNEIVINNNKLTFSSLDYKTSPASNIQFSNSNRPAVRESYYDLEISNTKYKSFNKPVNSGFTQDGYVSRQYYMDSEIGPLQIQSYVDVFVDNNFIEVETVVTNNTLDPITVSSLSLNWPIQGKFRTVYYNGGNASNFTPGQYSGLVVNQTSAGYAIVKDNTSTLVDGTGLNYSSWIASLSNNGKWYTAIIPGNMSKTSPRTIGRVGEVLYDEMININTTIAAGESVTYNTIILLEEAPVDATALSKIKIFAVNSGITSDTTPTYREDRDLPNPRDPYDRYQLEQQ